MEIVAGGLEKVNGDLSQDLIKVYNYEHIHTVFVDSKSSRLDSKGATPSRTTGGSFYGNPNMGK